MCEPSVSITQFPVDDPSSGDPLEPKLQSVLSAKVMSWRKKISSWLHWCRLGSGHSESMGIFHLSGVHLPDDIKYEGRWWSPWHDPRSFAVDGRFPSQYIPFKDDAERCARQYCEAVATGNMSVFRRFLEGSMKKSYTPPEYIMRFLYMLRSTGREELLGRLGKLFCPKTSRYSNIVEISYRNNPAGVIKCVMGYTRNRGLFLPEWADNDKIWTP